MVDQSDGERVGDLVSTPGLADALESERFKQFLDHLPIAIAVSELLPSEAITYANLEFERLIGQPASDLHGATWRKLPGIASAVGDEEPLSHAVETGEEYIGRFRIALDDGEVEVDAWSNTIQNDDGLEIFRLVALAQVGAGQQGDDESVLQKLRERDVLLLELQHRVKNNLQLITALIRMESRNIRDDETGQRFDRLAGRIHSLSLLYDLLSAQGVGEDIDLGVYLGKIAASVMEAHAVEGIRLDLTVDPWPVSINVAMPTGLVVNELLTNALKHAFIDGEGGTITLHSLVDDAGCRVTVADDGRGLPEGGSWPKRGKLGAIIVQSLRDNARAQVTVTSAPGEGMKVEIFFTRDGSEAGKI